jgi:hypothetical protein
VQLAMSRAPTSVAVVAVVCPKTGTATTTAAAHAAYLAAWLRMSTASNPVLSMFKGTISHSPYPAHGSSFVASYYLLMLATCPDVAR